MLYKYTRVPHALCSAQAPTLIRQNLKIKCFIAEDPRELQGSCGGAGTEVPCLLEDLKTVTVGTSTFQPQRWSRKYGLEGTRRPERGTITCVFSQLQVQCIQQCHGVSNDITEIAQIGAFFSYQSAGLQSLLAHDTLLSPLQAWPL
jgi:hypothetical protein